jgi:hypothetical protein
MASDPVRTMSRQYGVTRQLTDLVFTQQVDDRLAIATTRGPYGLAPILDGPIPFRSRRCCQDIGNSHLAAIFGKMHDWPLAFPPSEMLVR